MPEHSETNQAQNRTDSKGSDAPEVDAESRTTESNEHFSQREKRERLSRFETWQVATAVAGAILAFLGLLILWQQYKLLSRQNDIMKGQNDLMTEQTKLMDRQLAETKNGSIQAEERDKRSLEASIATFRLEQRPWLSVFGLGLASPVEVGKQISLSFSLRNNGRSPALSEYTQSIVSIHPPSTIPPMKQFPIKEPGSVQVIPPDSTLVSNVAAVLSDIFPAESVTAYLGKRARIYVHIIVRYRDVYRVPHWTTACYYHVLGESFKACASGNAVDNNQKEDDPVGPAGER